MATKAAVAPQVRLLLREQALREKRLPMIHEFRMNPFLKQQFVTEICSLLISDATFERVMAACRKVTPEAFLWAFVERRIQARSGTSYNPKMPAHVVSRTVLKTFLNKIDAVMPVVNRLAEKAARRGLSARLEIHHLISNLPFPTLVFRDSPRSKPLFWATIEPTGNSLSVRHIQGVKCIKRCAQGDMVDKAKLARLQRALEAMGYAKLRDGLFQDICEAARGRFRRVHYLHPSADKDFRDKPHHFYAMARRLNLKRTNLRATRVLRK